MKCSTIREKSALVYNSANNHYSGRLYFDGGIFKIIYRSDVIFSYRSIIVYFVSNLSRR